MSIDVGRVLNEQSQIDMFNGLADKVFAWSYENFGDQVNKSDLEMKLKYVNPLLGIIEELGELSDEMIHLAIGQRSITHVDRFTRAVDAVADINVFAADYAARSGIKLLAISDFNFIGFKNWERHALKLAAYLARVNLKTHQGIRGFDNPEFAKQEKEKTLIAVVSFTSRMYDLLQAFRPDSYENDPFYYPSLNAVSASVAVFNDHVSSRDWKSNPQSG